MEISLKLQFPVAELSSKPLFFGKPTTFERAHYINFFQVIFFVLFLLFCKTSHQPTAYIFHAVFSVRYLSVVLDEVFFLLLHLQTYRCLLAKDGFTMKESLYRIKNLYAPHNAIHCFVQKVWRHFHFGFCLNYAQNSVTTVCMNPRKEIIFTRFQSPAQFKWKSLLTFCAQ